MADLRAVLYCRISEDRTGEKAGVTRQEDDCRALAKQRGWSIVAVCTDNDISAAGQRKRPAFEEALRLLQSGEADVLVAWALDRVTRNRRDTVRLIETCQEMSSMIALVRGSDLDMSTPSGRLTADLLAAVARSEIEVKGDRQRRAVQQAVAEGRWVGGRRPFGYETDGLTLREAEAQAVRDGYSMLLAGSSLRAIGREWNRRGLLPPQGAPGWEGTVVRKCLTKARYVGLRSYKGQVTGPARWPSLVDPDTWHAAQGILLDPSRRPPKGSQRLLTGVAVCGVCGGPIHAGGGATGRGVYRCSTEAHFSRMRDPVEEYIDETVVALLSRADSTELLIPDTADERQDLMQEIDAAQTRLHALAEAYAEGAVTVAQLRAATTRLRGKVAAAEERLGTMSSASRLAGLVAGPDPVKVWNRMDVESQREIIRAMMTIRLMPPGRGVTKFDPATVVVELRARGA